MNEGALLHQLVVFNHAYRAGSALGVLQDVSAFDLHLQREHCGGFVGGRGPLGTVLAEVVGKVGEQLAVLEGPAGEEVEHCLLVVVDLNFLLENDHLELLNRPYFQDLQVEDLGGHPEELADSGDEALIHGDDGVAVIEGIVQGGEVADEGACLLQSFELVFVVEVVAQF